jgi:hypothetical protein
LDQKKEMTVSGGKGILCKDDLHNFNICSLLYRSRDSEVGITTGYGLGDRGVGVRVPVGSRNFSTSSRPALGPTQPPIQWVPAASFPGGKAARA